MLKEYVAVSSGSGQTPVEFVASFWDQRWRDLRDNRRLQRLREREEYRFLTKAIRDFGNRPLDILDCGCGQGEWTLLFQLEGHRSVGIDIAGETIRQLSAKHGEVFRFGDFRNIECADNSYDVVINWGGYRALRGRAGSGHSGGKTGFASGRVVYRDDALSQRQAFPARCVVRSGYWACVPDRGTSVLPVPVQSSRTRELLPSLRLCRGSLPYHSWGAGG